MTDMTIKISIDPDDRDRIDALIAALGDKKGKPAAGKKAAKKPAAEEAESAAEEEESDGPDRGDVRKALKAHAALEGKEAAIAILKKHGAASITELDESEFVATIADCGD